MICCRDMHAVYLRVRSDQRSRTGEQARGMIRRLHPVAQSQTALRAWIRPFLSSSECTDVRWLFENCHAPDAESLPHPAIMPKWKPPKYTIHWDDASLRAGPALAV